ncbi:hypothetical protein E6C67_08385 [Azospirillum sp. TSA2s]|uniref:hypothetical protein n=1 Tax=Azospirillum sp. TSA2s TaxID=709810 RepID=UPI0010AB23AD|nr:hypothetical protein [Azospirillum sp. TSA2s]QCG93956.1 hypothetical protein E6C67_08385 [Azospirillum sp. TSA2s]
MARQISIPSQYKIVQLTAPVTTNGGVTSDIISLKTAHKVTVIVDLKQAAGHATQVSLVQATSVAGSTNKAAPASFVWANEDAVASDTLVAQTNASSYTVANSVKSKQIVFEVDPSALDIANGYDCLYVTVGDSSQATNFVNITALLHTRFKQATPPSAIID